jgi:hypothetical protein
MGMGASSLRMGRLKRRGRALGGDRGAAVATGVVGEEDLLVLEHRSAQATAVDHPRLDPGALALTKAGLDAAVLAGGVEEARALELRLGRGERWHLRPPTPARAGHAGTDRKAGNGTKKELVPTIQGAGDYTGGPALESPR